jgi:hypothetical protein
MVLPVLTDLVYLVDYFVVMESIITYFEHISPLYRSIILFGGITIFWIMEGIIPVRHFRYNKWSHGGINLFFTGTTIVVNFALAFMMNGACQLARDYEFGFWNWIPLPFWLNVMVSLLLLDLVGAGGEHFPGGFYLDSHPDLWRSFWRGDVVPKHERPAVAVQPCQYPVAPVVGSLYQLCTRDTGYAPGTSPLCTALYRLQLWQSVFGLGPVVGYLSLPATTGYCIRDRYASQTGRAFTNQ